MATKKRSEGRRQSRPGRTVSLASEPSPIPDPPERSAIGGLLGELGISGTVNYDGRIQAEPHPDLRDFNARGRPGVGHSWGEWETRRRTDSAVDSAINLVKAPLREATLEVEPGAEGSAFELHAEFVRDNLLKWADPIFPMLVDEMVDTTLTSGFNLHETVLGTREDPRVPGGVAVYVAKIAQRLPSSLASNPWRELKGELAYVVQQGLIAQEHGGVRYSNDIRIPAGKVLLTTWNRSGNNYEGYSAIRSVRFLCVLREALLKIFAIGSEREALGIPVAKVDKDAKLEKGQVEKWQKFLEHIVAHEHAAAFPPAGVSIEWIFSPVSNKGHVLDAWERLGKAIHQVFLTQQVTLGVDGTGSRAVGEVHDGSKNEFVGGVKALIEATLNGVGERPYTGLAKRIIIPNFGHQAAYPRIKLVLKKREVSAAEMAQQLPAMKNAGMLTWRLDDENAFREKMGLAPVTPEEWEAEQDRKAEQAAAISGQFGAGAPDDDEAEPPKKGNLRALRRGGPTLKLAGRNVRLKRQLYAWEKHLALTEMAGFLENEKEALADAMGRALADAVRRAEPSIAAAMQDGKVTAEEIALDLSHVGDLVVRAARKARAEGYRHVAKEAQQQAKLSAKAQPVLLEEDDRDDGTAPIIDRDEDLVPSSPGKAQTPAEVERRAQAMIRAMRDKLLRRMRARVIDDIESEALYVIRNGGGDPAEVVNRVATRALEARGLKYDAGSVQAQSFSMGREEFAQLHGDQVQLVRYSAILDSATCVPCNQADGREFEMNSPEHDELTPPNRECRGGDNCRCLLVYEFKERGFRKVEEAPEP